MSPSATAPAAGLFPSIPSVPALNTVILRPAIFSTHASTNAEFLPPMPFPVTGEATSPSAIKATRWPGFSRFKSSNCPSSASTAFSIGHRPLNCRNRLRIRGLLRHDAPHETDRASPESTQNGHCQTPGAIAFGVSGMNSPSIHDISDAGSFFRNSYSRKNPMDIRHCRWIRQCWPGRQRRFLAGRNIRYRQRNFSCRTRRLPPFFRLLPLTDAYGLCSSPRSARHK